MRRFAVIVVSGVLVSGCDTHAQRMDAIAEVETACGLAPNTIRRAAADQKAISGSVVDIRDGESVRTEKLWIALGPYMPGPVLDRRGCIEAFESKRGYNFDVRAISPTAI